MRKLIGKILPLAVLVAATVMSSQCRAGVEGKTPMVKVKGEKTYMFRVQLADKSGCGFSVDNPQQFLSPKALQRRLRQNLSVDSTDLPVNRRYEELLEKKGCEVVSRSKWNNTVVARTTDSCFAASVTSLPFVRSARLVWTSPDSVKVARPRPKYHETLALHDTAGVTRYGATEEQLRMLGAQKLHSQGYYGQGMTIAVLDAGFLNADLIPALRNINLVGFADFVVPRSKSIFKEMEHGEQVLSVMAVKVPGVYVGAAPDASYVLLRCEDEQTEQPVEEDWWAAAAEYADSLGVDVINSSLGFHDYDNPSDSYRYWQQDGKTALISRTAAMLASKGIVLVNSCGNDGMGTWKRINFPSDADNILAVGAITKERRNAAFSSMGPTADGRVKPDVVAPGSPVAVVTERGTVSSSVGTSFAAPLVAGMVACAWQKHPEKTASEIIEAVRKSGDNAAHPDNVYGYGLPDFANLFQEDGIHQ